MQPYIGITGVDSLNDARMLAPLAKDESTHRLMIGYAMTSRSLNGSNPAPRYVALGELPSLLFSTRKAFNVIHYSTRNTERTLAELTQILTFDNIYKKGQIHGVQFNTSIEPEEMETLKSDFPDLYCILPIHTIPTPEVLGPTLQNILRFPADSFMIDPSRGTGELFDLQQASDFYLALREVTQLPGGFAGGFTPENVQRRVGELTRLVGEPFSLDVETGVRSEEKFDPSKAINYVLRGRQGFN